VDDSLVRVEAGAVVDEFELPGVGEVVARHTRGKAPDGSVQWACTFTIVATGTADLAVVHRLSAPSLAEARRRVRNAVEFLAGRAGIAALPPLSDRQPRVSDRQLRVSDRSRDGAGRQRREADRAPRIPVFDLPEGFDTAGPRDPFDRRSPTPLS
jgi:hypothetical protein